MERTKEHTEQEGTEEIEEEQIELIVEEFHKEKTGPCWNCVHAPCLCTLLKLELRMSMLREVKDDLLLKNKCFINLE